MAIDFKKLNATTNAKALAKQAEEAKKNGGFKLDEGDYICSLETLELAETKNGAIKVSAKFNITSGDAKGKNIFVNKVMTGTKNDGFMVMKACEFLESLDTDVEDISFNGDWEAFNDLVLDIADAVSDLHLSYEIAIRDNEKNPKYSDIEITDVFDD